MPRLLTGTLVLLISTWVFTNPVLSEPAQQGKPLLDTQIVFEGGGKADVKYTPHVKSAKDLDGYKMESALIFYAYAMHQLNETKARDLMNQVQRSVTRIATEEGLKRADLLKNNDIMKVSGQDTAGKGFDIKFEEISGQGHSLNVAAREGSEALLAPAVFYYFQDAVNHLPENALRITVLAMGGMNKWYREVGKASDPGSVSAAPSYGLNIAVDIIGKLSGKKI